VGTLFGLYLMHLKPVSLDSSHYFCTPILVRLSNPLEHKGLHYLTCAKDITVIIELWEIHDLEFLGYYGNLTMLGTSHTNLQDSNFM